MFDNDFNDEELINAVKSGECTAPEGYKFDGKSIIRKTEEEILANDWNSSNERKCEYEDYLIWSIAKMENYLSKTDWYISRKSETGKDIPEDVVLIRSNYREKISNFRERLSAIES